MRGKKGAQRLGCDSQLCQCLPVSDIFININYLLSSYILLSWHSTESCHPATLQIPKMTTHQCAAVVAAPERPNSSGSSALVIQQPIQTPHEARPQVLHSVSGNWLGRGIATELQMTPWLRYTDVLEVHPHNGETRAEMHPAQPELSLSCPPRVEEPPIYSSF